MSSADLVEVRDYEAAIGVCHQLLSGITSQPPGPLGHVWLEQAIAHLRAKADRYFRDTPKVTTEQHAAAQAQRSATHLQSAGQSLLHAAERLKAKQDSHGANLTYRAGQKALAQAEELHASA